MALFQYMGKVDANFLGNDPAAADTSTEWFPVLVDRARRQPRRTLELPGQDLSGLGASSSQDVDWIPTVPARRRELRRQRPDQPADVLGIGAGAFQDTDWLPTNPVRRNEPRRQRFNQVADILGLSLSQLQRLDWQPSYPPRAHKPPRLQHQYLAYIDHINGDGVASSEMSSTMTLTGVEVDGYRGYGRWRH